jgi:hypothetical protein
MHFSFHFVSEFPEYLGREVGQTLRQERSGECRPEIAMETIVAAGAAGFPSGASLALFHSFVGGRGAGLQFFGNLPPTVPTLS